MAKKKDHTDFICGAIGTLVMFPISYVYFKKVLDYPKLIMPWIVLLVYIYLHDYKLILKEKSISYTLTNFTINCIFASNVVFMILTVIKYIYKVIHTL